MIAAILPMLTIVVGFCLLAIYAFTKSNAPKNINIEAQELKTEEVVELNEIREEIYDNDIYNNEVSDKELIAVISAAIAAYLGENASSSVITSIKPVRNSSTPWNIMAKRENHRGLY